jgi:polysaccharide export outer membrane protein
METTTSASGGNSVVLPGENLEVFVVEDSSFNGRYQVRRGGYIILPQVGRISVAGKQISEAEAAIRHALESSQLKHASVMVERLEGSDVTTGPVIYLAGEFKLTHAYRIPEGTAPTLVNVIVSVGVTEKADLSHVRVERVAAFKGVVEEVNVQKILDGGGLSSDVTLNDGDLVVVPSGPANVVYLTGNVRREGALPIKPTDKMTAYAAILQVGGFARFADLKKVYVLRSTPDGTKIKIPVNIVGIQKGHTPDVPLQANDVIVVPERFFSF